MTTGTDTVERIDAMPPDILDDDGDGRDRLCEWADQWCDEPAYGWIDTWLPDTAGDARRPHTRLPTPLRLPPRNHHRRHPSRPRTHGRHQRRTTTSRRAPTRHRIRKGIGFSRAGRPPAATRTGRRLWSRGKQRRCSNHVAGARECRFGNPGVRHGKESADSNVTFSVIIPCGRVRGPITERQESFCGDFGYQNPIQAPRLPPNPITRPAGKGGNWLPGSIEEHLPSGTTLRPRAPSARTAV